ncbi:MAG: phosphoglycerate dehydrogenase [Chloroflexi bacterium]|nr:phosphoglycerate dehydrogenase [Chloroflexota bacterium]MCC6894934.1 phosphoglycerate dehydrogenase [Anaerolineae bacterium]
MTLASPAVMTPLKGDENLVPTYHILVATDLAESSLKILQESADITIQQVTPSAVRDSLSQAHALIARDDVRIDKTLLETAPNLKLIGRVGAGLNGIDIEAATNRGIIVMNTPGTNAIAAGEHAIALMLALSRRLVVAHDSLKDGWWLLDRKRQAGTQLFEKTLGIIGLGRVGSVVAKRALAFGMTVLAYDPYMSEDQLLDERVQLVGLKELLTRSDFITLHVAATPETADFINANTLAQMKQGARLINTSHGSVIDEAAVAAALKDGHLAGVAVDVYRDEPPYNSPLVGLDNVIHTPRIGDNTIEAMQDLSLQIVKQVLDALHGKDYRNVVNMPFVPGLDFETARPYMRLAECMGTMIHALSRSPVSRVAVEYRGEEMSGLVKALAVAILKGLLQPVLGNKVNTINAPVLAAERGIQVTQAKGMKTGDYASMVSCEVTLEDGENILMAGTLLDRKEPHIVQINQYRMNFVPEGHLLLMGSFDQPGVIGKVGTLMATNNVNIASWHTGRAEPGGHTFTVLALDLPLPIPVLDELLGLEFVRHAHQVEIKQ